MSYQIVVYHLYNWH